jgi:hypothetical protein
MGFYPPGGSFKFHRDELLQKNGNCKPVADAELVQTKRYVHKADEGRVSFRACNMQRQRTLEANRYQVLWHGPRRPRCHFDDAAHGRARSWRQRMGHQLGDRLHTGPARSSPGADRQRDHGEPFQRLLHTQGPARPSPDWLSSAKECS